MQSLANSMELNSAFCKVTSKMKPEGKMYQAETQVNVLSSVIPLIAEVDTVHISGRLNYVIQNRRGLCNSAGVLGIGMIQDGSSMNLGDPLNSSEIKSLECIETSHKRQGSMDPSMEVGLIDGTRSMGKPCTWGSDQQRRNGFSTSLSDTLKSGSK
jgi:hypothetical protein